MQFWSIYGTYSIILYWCNNFVHSHDKSILQESSCICHSEKSRNLARRAFHLLLWIQRTMCDFIFVFFFDNKCFKVNLISTYTVLTLTENSKWFGHFLKKNIQCFNPIPWNLIKISLVTSVQMFLANWFIHGVKVQYQCLRYKSSNNCSCTFVCYSN